MLRSWANLKVLNLHWMQVLQAQSLSFLEYRHRCSLCKKQWMKLVPSPLSSLPYSCVTFSFTIIRFLEDLRKWLHYNRPQYSCAYFFNCSSNFLEFFLSSLFKFVIFSLLIFFSLENITLLSLNFEKLSNKKHLQSTSFAFNNRSDYIFILHYYYT